MDASPVKVQFGAGGNRLPDWTNHDSEVDISKALPYADHSVDMVFAEHVVEHISHIQALAFLDECFRILKVGGAIRLCIPVLERLEPAHARDIITGHGHQAAYSTQLIKDFLRAAGFAGIRETARSGIDGHFTVIGTEKDSEETARIEALRP